MNFPSDEEFKLALGRMRAYERKVQGTETEIEALKNTDPLTNEIQAQIHQLESRLTTERDRYNHFKDLFDGYRNAIDEVIQHATDIGVVFPEALSLPRDLDLIRQFFINGVVADEEGFNPFEGYFRARDDDPSSKHG